MKKNLALICMLALTAPTLAKPSQIIPPIAERARAHFAVSQRDFTVDPLRRYRVFIAVPKTAAPKRGYPVLYMLDGNAQFPLAVNGYRPENGAAPLIVAIGYQSELAYITSERTRDYTPYSAGEEFAQGGQAEAFYQFIVQRLKPWVEQQYPVDNTRQTLAGHSFGGLFSLYTLFNHTGAFQRYIAASPSIWWGNGIVIPDRTPLIVAPPRSIIISVGEYEETADPAKASKATAPARLAKRAQVTKARDLADRLRRQGVNVSFILFAGKSHGGAIPDALNTAVIEAAR